MIITITDDNFDAEVREYDDVVLVDCFAEWCSPCKALKPLLTEIAEESGVKVGLLDIEANPGLAHELSVTSIPKVVIFKKGEQVTEMLGVRSKKDYQDIIDSLKAD